MYKSLELDDPNSCLNKATPGEMIFVILARDPAAQAAIKAWVDKRIELGLNEPTDPKIQSAVECSLIMEQQRPYTKEGFGHKQMEHMKHTKG